MQVDEVVQNSALTPKQLQWQEELSKYPIKLEHKRGKDNTVADALSKLTITPIELEPLVDSEFLKTLKKLYPHDAETGIIYTHLRGGD